MGKQLATVLGGKNKASRGALLTEEEEDVDVEKLAKRVEQLHLNIEAHRKRLKLMEDLEHSSLCSKVVRELQVRVEALT